MLGLIEQQQFAELEKELAMNEKTQPLETLSRSDLFHPYQQAYAGMTGLPAALRPVETW